MSAIQKGIKRMTDLVKRDNNASFNPEDFHGDAGLRQGDRFTLHVPELIVTSVDRDYLNFKIAGDTEAYPTGHTNINRGMHYPFAIVKVYTPGEIAVDMKGVTWGFDGKVWRNKDGDEMTTAELREHGARVMPTVGL
jgi:hypothetical protein